MDSVKLFLHMRKMFDGQRKRKSRRQETSPNNEEGSLRTTTFITLVSKSVHTKGVWKDQTDRKIRDGC